MPSQSSFIGVNARFIRPTGARKLFSRRHHNHSMNHGAHKNMAASHMDATCAKKHKSSTTKKIALLVGGVSSYLLFLVMLFAILFIAILAVSLGYWSGRKIVDYTHKHQAIGAFAHLKGSDIVDAHHNRKHKSHVDSEPKAVPAVKAQRPKVRYESPKRKYSVNHQLIKLYA